MYVSKFYAKRKPEKKLLSVRRETMMLVWSRVVAAGTSTLPQAGVANHFRRRSRLPASVGAGHDNVAEAYAVTISDAETVWDLRMRSSCMIWRRA